MFSFFRSHGSDVVSHGSGCRAGFLQGYVWSSLICECVIALSHIHVSAAYHSRIYEKCDTPRSEPNFVRATYVPRTCDVLAMIPWRISDVSVFVWKFTFVCTAYQGVCAAK